MSVQDFTCKYDGRVLRLELFVNTDENETEVLARAVKAARGQVRNAVMSTALVYSGSDGKKVWAAVQQFSAKAHANPKGVDVDDDLKPVKP